MAHSENPMTTSPVGASLPDDVISLTPLPPMIVVGDASIPQFRMAMRVRAPSDVAKYARTAPPGLVIFCLWDLKGSGM